MTKEDAMMELVTWLCENLPLDTLTQIARVVKKWRKNLTHADPTTPLEAALVRFTVMAWEKEKAEWPEEFDDPIRVVTLDLDGDKCTWDNIRALKDELETWWDEGEDDKVTVTFHTMSEEAYKALPEFDGW